MAQRRGFEMVEAMRGMIFDHRIKSLVRYRIPQGLRLALPVIGLSRRAKSCRMNLVRTHLAIR